MYIPGENRMGEIKYSYRIWAKQTWKKECMCEI